MRLIAYPTCLAGQQLKVGAYESWACDECWEQYNLSRKTLEDNGSKS